MPTPIIPGRLTWLEVLVDGDWLNVAGVVDVNLDSNTDALDITTRDDGRRRRFLPNHRDHTVDVNGRWISRDRGQGAVRAAENTGSFLTFRMGLERVPDAVVFVFDAFVRQLKRSGPLDESAGIDFTLRVSGELAVDALQLPRIVFVPPAPPPPPPPPPPLATMADSFEHDDGWVFTTMGDSFEASEGWIPAVMGDSFEVADGWIFTTMGDSFESADGWS